MLHQINLRWWLTTGAIISVAVAGTIATTGQWSSVGAGLFGPAAPVENDLGPVARPLGYRADATAHLAAGAGASSRAGAPFELDLPPLFEPTGARVQRGTDGHASVSTPSRTPRNRTTRTPRGSGGMAAASGVRGGVGGGGVARRNTSPRNAANENPPAGNSATSGGGGSSSGGNSAGGSGSGSGSNNGSSAGSAGAAGVFAEQNAPIGALADRPVDLAAGLVDGAGGALGASLSQMASTPEPGSLLLIGTGLLGLVGALRRRFV